VNDHAAGKDHGEADPSRRRYNIVKNEAAGADAHDREEAHVGSKQLREVQVELVDDDALRPEDDEPEGHEQRARAAQTLADECITGDLERGRNEHDQQGDIGAIHPGPGYGNVPQAASRRVRGAVRMLLPAACRAGGAW
jgi:hypothetical protein